MIRCFAITLGVSLAMFSANPAPCAAQGFRPPSMPSYTPPPSIPRYSPPQVTHQPRYDMQRRSEMLGTQRRTLESWRLGMQRQQETTRSMDRMRMEATRNNMDQMQRNQMETTRNNMDRMRTERNQMEIMRNMDRMRTQQDQIRLSQERLNAERLNRSVPRGAISNPATGRVGGVGGGGDPLVARGPAFATGSALTPQEMRRQLNERYRLQRQAFNQMMRSR